MFSCEFPYRQSTGSVSNVLGVCTNKWAAVIQTILLVVWFAYVLIFTLECYQFIANIVRFVPQLVLTMVRSIPCLCSSKKNTPKPIVNVKKPCPQQPSEMSVHELGQPGLDEILLEKPMVQKSKKEVPASIDIEGGCCLLKLCCLDRVNTTQESKKKAEKNKDACCLKAYKE